jgi:hypothetical protein
LDGKTSRTTKMVPPLTTSPPMFGCLKMYMLCTGSGRLKPRLRHTADTEGDRVNDLQTTTSINVTHVDSIKTLDSVCRQQQRQTSLWP